MKLISFNMRFGGSRKGTSSWQQIIDALDPDLVFGQESFDPSQYLAPGTLTRYRDRRWRATAGTRWGSALVSKDWSLESIALASWDGWVVGSRVSDFPVGAAHLPTTIVSVHVPSKGSYIATVNRIFDDIAENWDGGPLIVAGDFNVTTAFRHRLEPVTMVRSEERLLHRLRTEFGLLNAWQVLHPNLDLAQTLRWSSDTSKPYHCDAIFLSQHFIRHVVRAEILAADPWIAMSDHNPIIVELE